MTLRLIYSRPMAVDLASDRPQPVSRASLLRRIVSLVLEAMQGSRARTAERELRRYQYLAHHDEARER